MSDTSTATNTIVKVKEPKMYKVVIYNDDYTPSDFVVMVLTDLFSKSQEEAVALMREIHEKGKGTPGVFTREVAEQKSFEVMSVAKQVGHHHLRSSAEPA